MTSVCPERADVVTNSAINYRLDMEYQSSAYNQHHCKLDNSMHTELCNVSFDCCDTDHHALTNLTSTTCYDSLTNTHLQDAVWPQNSALSQNYPAELIENLNVQNQNYFEQMYFQTDFKENYSSLDFYGYCQTPSDECSLIPSSYDLQEYMFPKVDENRCRKPKNRILTNVKKRERNTSLNKAFEQLREKIPNLPPDTKVSKIKVLRLAVLYIRHLSNVLHKENDNETESLPNDEESSSTSTNEKTDKTARKRCSEEFIIDPNLVALKRRKTDMPRLKEEIRRYELSQIKQIEKQRSRSVQDCNRANNYLATCFSLPSQLEDEASESRKLYRQDFSTKRQQRIAEQFRGIAR